MTFSIALPKSLDTAPSAAGLTSENGQKSAGFEGTDGFAELLSQLASFTPSAGQDDTAEADRQAGDLPTGKELPLAALGLPVLDNTLAAPTALDAQGGEGKPAAGGLVPNAPKTDLAMTAPTPRATAPGAGLADAAGEKPVAGLEVRISVAQEPRDPRAAGMVSSLQTGKAAMDLPAVAAHGRAEAAPVVTAPQGETKASVKAAATETAVAAPAKAEPAALQGAGTVQRSAIGERKIGDKALAEKLASKPRTTAASDAAKSMPQALAVAADGSASTIQPVSSAARPIATDQFANVERVVEHLMAARQFDLSKPAAIAVAHKEFGALTLTFDHSAGGMNVEIATEDGEAQRALAAAMANDRGATRAQDLTAQSPSSATQPGQTGGERGAANNAGTGSGNAAGDDQRQQTSDQRSRHGERAPNQPQAPAQSSSDDALYA
ncbi:MAG: hypothetical protein ACKVGV_01735 [Sphingomonadales bacterium]|jgi:hypothetical protein